MLIKAYLTLTTSNGYVEIVAPSFARAPNKKTFTKEGKWEEEKLFYQLKHIYAPYKKLLSDGFNFKS